MLLPFVEQVPLYNAINFRIDNCLNGNPSHFSRIYLDANSTAFGILVPGYLCPSEPNLAGWQVWGPNSYEANAGTRWTMTNVNDGPFFIMSRTSFASVVDGLSQTAAFSEHARGVGGPTDGPPGPLTGRLIRPQNSSRSQAELERWCDQLDPPAAQIFTIGPNSWASEGGYRHVFRPNHHTCDESADPMDHVYGRRIGSYAYSLDPPTSYHPGGVNLLLLDGSVRFIQETIAPGPWRALGTRAGGEIVSSGDY
jgi:prepilin-type processing-associated H-X9-DG protein